MKLSALKKLLRQHPNALPRFILPDGDSIAQHFHITEVGHIAKRFIDCGGTLHDKKDTCLLQTYVAHDVDHRLTAGAMAAILDLGAQVLPHDDLEVEVEYEDCSVTQSPITDAKFTGEFVELQLGEKHTDCLDKEKCGLNGEGCGRNAETDAAIVGTLAATVSTCC